MLKLIPYSPESHPKGLPRCTQQVLGDSHLVRSIGWHFVIRHFWLRQEIAVPEMCLKRRKGMTYGIDLHDSLSKRADLPDNGETAALQVYVQFLALHEMPLVTNVPRTQTMFPCYAAAAWFCQFVFACKTGSWVWIPPRYNVVAFFLLKIFLNLQWLQHQNAAEVIFRGKRYEKSKPRA
jgi:hypothetical protein